MKKCSACNQVKNELEFFKNSKQKDGLSTECKICSTARRDKWRRENSEKYHEANKKYYQKRRNNPKTKELDKKKGRIFSKSPKGRFNKIKTRAKMSNLDFSITLDYIEKLWNTKCYYCGEEVKGIGLDRIDNEKGYTQENTVQCCKRCNVIKNNMSLTEFQNKITNIYNNYIKHTMKA